MRDRIFNWAQGLALSSLCLTACDPQVTPEYLGKQLLKMRGHVVIDSHHREPLEPVLAFMQPETSRLHVMDVEVEGGFPSDFTLEVYQPPPEETLQHRPGGPPFALGYLGAMAEEHPRSVLLYTNTSEIAYCDWPEDAMFPDRPCTASKSWCALNAECYQEIGHCPIPEGYTYGPKPARAMEGAPLDPPPPPAEGLVRLDPNVCEIQSEGDPSFKQDTWEHFVGLSEDLLVLYFAEPLRADDPAARALDFQKFEAGYNLVRVVEVNDRARRILRQDCEFEAFELALQRYNERYGAQLSVRGDPKRVAWRRYIEIYGERSWEDSQGNLHPEFVVDQDLEGGELDWGSYSPLYADARKELWCPSWSYAMERIELSGQEPISVRIASDVKPTTWVGGDARGDRFIR